MFLRKYDKFYFYYFFIKNISTKYLPDLSYIKSYKIQCQLQYHTVKYAQISLFINLSLKVIVFQGGLFKELLFQIFNQLQVIRAIIINRRTMEKQKNIYSKYIFVALLLFTTFSFILASSPTNSIHRNLRKVTSQHTSPRILQETNTNNIIVSFATYIQWTLILLIIAMISNTFTIFLPIILYSQSFYYMGFLAVERGMLGDFYKQLLNNKVSLFGIVKMVFGVDTSNPDNGLPDHYREAGVQMRLLHNVIPIYGILAILLVFTIIVLLLNLILKSQKLRKLILILKSVWNGSLYCLMPNLCFCMGTSSFFLSFQTTDNIIDVVTFAVSGIILVVYFALLIVQIKNHVTHPSVQDMRKSVSIILPLKSSQFRFDCIVFSNKYFYVQIYLKTIIYYFGIGITYDYPKVGVGMCLLGQLIQFIVFITNPPYIKLRHNIMSGFYFLILMVSAFCLLLIDLNEVVDNSQVATYFIYVFLMMHLVTLLMLLVNAIVDIVLNIKKLIFKNNVKQRKNKKKDISIYDQETNVKLHAEGSEKSEPVKKHKSKSRGKKNRNKQSSQDKYNCSLTKNDFSSSKQSINEKSRVKINVYDQKENSSIDIPKIKKIKKARQI